MDTIPIFHTNLSFRSILSLDDAGKQSPEEAPSLFDCAEDLGLKKIVVIDDYPTAFMPLLRKTEGKYDFKFGLRVIVCNDINNKDEGAENTHAKYNIIARNGEGCMDLFRIFSFSATVGHWRINKLQRYNRIDWENLKRMWTKNLSLVPCFYDGPAYMNLFTFSEHIPDLDFFDPYFEVQEHDLPFDKPLLRGVEAMADGKVIKTHSIYYRKRDEYDAFVTYKAILGRQPGRKAGFYEPNIDNLFRDNFCSEFLVDNR